MTMPARRASRFCARSRSQCPEIFISQADFWVTARTFLHAKSHISAGTRRMQADPIPHYFSTKRYFCYTSHVKSQLAVSTRWMQADPIPNVERAINRQPDYRAGASYSRSHGKFRRKISIFWNFHIFRQFLNLIFAMAPNFWKRRRKTDSRSEQLVKNNIELWFATSKWIVKRQPHKHFCMQNHW